MEIFIAHFWYILGTFVAGIYVGVRFQQQIKSTLGLGLKLLLRKNSN